MIKEIPEKQSNDYPKPISIEQNKTILDQMKNNGICKIHGKNEGNGFFTKIPFPDNNNLLPVLITNNHILNESVLNNREIVISQNDNKKNIRIKR